MGSFAIQASGRGQADLPRKAQALIALLALQPGRAMPREAVVDLLWSGTSRTGQCPSLRDTLMVIRQQTGTGLVRLRDDTLSLTGKGLWIDALEFQGLAGASCGHGLAHCAALYRGELLANVATVTPRFDEWLAVERIRLGALAHEVLRALALSLAEAGEHEAAVRAARRLVSLDELREDSHHLLISLLGRCGRRNEALRHYCVCEQLLTPPPAEPEPEPEPEHVAIGAAELPPGGGRGWWMRGVLVVACLFAVMVNGVALEVTQGQGGASPIISAADTIGVVRLSDAAPPGRLPSGPELPVW